MKTTKHYIMAILAVIFLVVVSYPYSAQAAEPKYDTFCKGDGGVNFLVSVSNVSIFTKFPDGEVDEFRIVRRTDNIVIGTDKDGLMFALRGDGAWAVTPDRGETIVAGGKCELLRGA